MSSKGHILYEPGIEIYNETNEPREVLGKFVGWDVYIIIENTVLKGFSVVNSRIIIATDTPHFPKTITISGDAVERVDWDEDGIIIQLKGGNYTTNLIENKEFDKLKIQ